MSRGKIVDKPPIPISFELYEELVKEADEKFFSITDYRSRRENS
jgi:hypothetical protein